MEHRENLDAQPRLDFSAELQAIVQDLKTVYNDSSYPLEVVFSDSNLALKAVQSTNLASNEAVVAIRQLIDNLRSCGTQIRLIWIPSHVEKHGNEAADYLARLESESPSGQVINNVL